MLFWYDFLTLCKRCLQEMFLIWLVPKALTEIGKEWQAPATLCQCNASFEVSRAARGWELVKASGHFSGTLLACWCLLCKSVSVESSSCSYIQGKVREPADNNALGSQRAGFWSWLCCLQQVIVVGQPWHAATLPTSRSVTTALQQAGGENSMRKCIGEGEEVTYQLLSWALLSTCRKMI